MSLVQRPYRAAFSVLFASFVMFGVSITVIGAALPKVLADFHWGYVAAGLVLASGSLGYFVSAWAAGKVVDRLGFRTSMSLGLICNAVGLFLFAWQPSVPVNALLYFLIGIGQGFIEVAVNWSIVKMAEGHSSRPMSLMHGAFSIGAVAGPLAVGALLAAEHSWSLAYRIMGLLFGVLLVAAWTVPTHGLAGTRPEDAERPRPLHGDLAFWLGFGVLMLYVGVEMGISNWMSEYFVSILGAVPSLGALSVSAFWGGLLAGRFGLPLCYRGHRHGRVLLVLGLLLTGATATLATVGFTGGLPVAFAASAVAGLGCSCVYPVAISLVGQAFPEAQGEAMGFASAGGGLGALVFPFGTAWVAKAWGLRTGYVLFVFLSLAVLASCVWLAAVVQRRVGPMPQPRGSE